MARPKLALQIGHYRQEQGARYEVETLLQVFPHIVASLERENVKFDQFDGKLVNVPGNYSLKYDLFLAVHCDSGSDKSSGYSIGWSTYPAHPGSEDWAKTIAKRYQSVTGLRKFGENHTVGLKHYYGYRRMRQGCKCALIELGFVSNPLEREWLIKNAALVGDAVAAGVLDYLEDKELSKKEGEAMLGIIQGEVKPNSPFATAGIVVSDEGKEVYIDIINFGSQAATVNLLLQRENGDYCSVRCIVPASQPGIFGLVNLKLSDSFKNRKIGKFILKVESNYQVSVRVTQIL